MKVSFNVYLSCPVSLSSPPLTFLFLCKLIFSYALYEKPTKSMEADSARKIVNLVSAFICTKCILNTFKLVLFSQMKVIFSQISDIIAQIHHHNS